MRGPRPRSWGPHGSSPRGRGRPSAGFGVGPRAMAAREGQKGRAEGKGHRAPPDSAWSLPEPFPNARSSARGRRHRQPPREVLLRQLPAASLCEGRAGGRERGREGGREGGRLLVGREGLPVLVPPGRGTAQGRSGSARCLCQARERGACPTAPQTNERGRGTSWIRSWTRISTSWLCNGVAVPVLAWRAAAPWSWSQALGRAQPCQALCWKVGLGFSRGEWPYNGIDLSQEELFRKTLF